MPFQSYNRFAFGDRPIVNETVDGVTLGYQFDIRYPSYRGTFLSCIESLEVAVDGQSVPQEDLLFELNGKQFLIPELPDLFREYWFVLDYATLKVRKPGGLPVGSSHEVELRMSHRIPYTGYFGQYLVLRADEKRTLTVCEKGEGA